MFRLLLVLELLHCHTRTSLPGMPQSVLASVVFFQEYVAVSEGETGTVPCPSEADVSAFRNVEKPLSC